MSEMNCYGISGRAGFVVSGIFELGICLEDDFPYFTPSGRIGFGGNLIGGGASIYKESTTYDTSTSYAAETDESWFRVNVTDTGLLPLIGSLFTSGRSDTDYKDDNVKRTDYMIGLGGTFPLVNEWGDTAPPGHLTLDVFALAWNGFFDAAEATWYGLESAATYISENAAYAAEATWDGACSVLDNAAQYWETVFNW